MFAGQNISCHRHLTAVFAIGLYAALTANVRADPLVDRGKYLADAGDCIACHTAPGGKRLAGGLYMKTPFGNISTPNITPDKQSGIGAWSDDQFYRALHEGVGHEGELLYPVFPFPWYTKVTRDDAMAIKAYLFTQPAEHAPRKPFRFAFPFSIRTSLLAWRTAFFKPGTFKPDPSASAKVNRGAYLVEGLGHCGECHNQHNVFGASDWSGKLEGGEINGWYAPNITSDGQQGIGTWSEDEIATFLKTGAARGRSVALGPMMETINDSLSKLSDEDRHAMAAYLKSVAAKQSIAKSDSSQGLPASRTNAEAYLGHCASCHQPDGKGIEGAIPALVGNGAVTAKGPQNVIRVVLGGAKASHGLAPMVAVGQDMSDEDVAAAVNYVRSAWGNSAPENAGPGMVATLRKETISTLAGNARACPPIDNPSVAKAVSGVQDQLRGIDPSNAWQSVDTILTKLKASNPGATGDDLVNGLTAAYCPIVQADASMPQDRKAVAIGNFSGIVYSQIKKIPAK